MIMMIRQVTAEKRVAAKKEDQLDPGKANANGRHNLKYDTL